MMSKSAKKIYQLLRAAGYTVQCEYSFPDLKGKNGTLLRFDFAILLNNRLVLVEYDGEAHFNKISHFHATQSDYKRAKERDRKKNKFCLMKNIPLYRIPYFELDNISNASDIFCDRFLVKDKYHNDYIKAP